MKLIFALAMPVAAQIAAPALIGQAVSSSNVLRGVSLPDGGVAPAARKALATDSVSWIHRRTANADIYVLANTPVAAMAATLSRDAERAIDANMRWLGERRRGERLRLFFVGSRQEMRPFTGTRAGGWSFVEEGTAFFVASEIVRPAIRHETMHLLSWRHWGTPGGRWLSEGTATFAAGSCGVWTIDQIGAALYKEGRLATISELRRNFTLAGDRGAVNYLSAASLVSFVDSEFGRAKLRELWTSGGLERARQTLGIGVGALEQRWRQHLSRKTSPQSWKEMSKEIELRGCE